jgi:hypothetical protein
MNTGGLRLGAPGVYYADRPREPQLQRIRLDVAGFAGVAPRGPVDEPVAVESWSDFRWRYGGTEGPGLLPHAVRTFFAQGGVRAFVCRLSPLPRASAPEAALAHARHLLPLATTTATRALLRTEVEVLARDEGSWGGRLVVEVEFVAADRFTSTADGAELTLPTGAALPVGATLRLRGDGLPAEGVFRGVEALELRTDEPGSRRQIAVLDEPVTTRPGPSVRDIDVVTASVRVTDTDPLFARQEAFDRLGLRATHPAFVRDILAKTSRLVAPGPQWPEVLLPPDLLLTTAVSRPDPDRPGVDRLADIGRNSLFTDLPAELLPTDLVDAEGLTIAGADALALVPEVALLSIPDLFWSHVEEAPTSVQPPPPVTSMFGPCRPVPPALTLTPVPVHGARLDARTQLAEVLERQLRLVALADHLRRFVALLDVPEHLSVAGIARWRASFDSTYAAAYHPWLGVAPDRSTGDSAGSGDGAAVLLGPSAFAAGIVADRERRLGLPWGPANTLAAGAVLSAVAIDDAEHDALHALDIDVLRAERDGFRLSSAHTLSRDQQYRQLSVRRLMTMLRLVIERQCQYLAFEPHTLALRRQVARTVTALLRDLFRAGAFSGATEADAFFVRCDETVNPQSSVDLGRLVAEVGVAPASPLEYLVLRVRQDTEGQLRVEG